MTDQLAEGMPIGVDLIRRLSPAEDRGLLALSVADAVTDATAIRLLLNAGFERGAESFVRLVRSCDFVVDRNHEWRLATDAKAYLQSVCVREQLLWAQTNTWLLDQAAQGSREIGMLPNYLRDRAGVAYHLAATDPEAGTAKYTELAVAAEWDSSHDSTWLADRLATSQRQLGILPAESQDLGFLSAMNRYCNGSRYAAIGELRPIAEMPDETMPIAVACHIVGRWDGDRHSSVDYRRAIRMLRRSITIGEHLGSARHVAQDEHSLALIILQNDRKIGEVEAFQLLDNSLRTLEAYDDPFGVAKVLHTYGQALVRRDLSGDRDRARAMYGRSLQIGHQLGKPFHEAKVLRSIASLVGPTSPETAYRARALAERLAPIQDARPRKGSRRGRQRRR